MKELEFVSDNLCGCCLDTCLYVQERIFIFVQYSWSFSCMKMVYEVVVTFGFNLTLRQVKNYHNFINFDITITIFVYYCCI